MAGTKHTWIDGPDGSKYHCPVCGISRCDDWANYNTCEKFILVQAKRVEREGSRLPLFDVDARQWQDFQNK